MWGGVSVQMSLDNIPFASSILSKETQKTKILSAVLYELKLGPSDAWDLQSIGVNYQTKNKLRSR
jgi:hypothetical protein